MPMRSSGWRYWNVDHLDCQIENRVGEKDKHYYTDIVIKNLSQTIILELLATSTKSNLNEHFSRALKYADNLSASEIWIVHFTCEDSAT
ncbi:hypothetical protein C1646_688685 [Rhizophagus diaphanus]|nr:hypothetical protein C1646_688685 [Rhizophagus diaphanus] [Rhizophagus sp. MUCL 43196]